MRRSSITAAAILSAVAAVAAGAALAKPEDDLKSNGFVVVRQTSVMGDFEGCERDRAIPLVGGGVFTCASFGYMHAHNPKAVLLKSKDGRQYKLVIQGAVFDGSFST